MIAEHDNGAAPRSPSREYIYSGGPEGSGLLAKIDSSGTRRVPKIRYEQRQRMQYVSGGGSRGNLQRSLPFQEGDQFFARETRFTKQGKQGALRHVAVMSGHDSAAL